ncbi:type VI secretion system baseplate subunit TssK [Erwinia phyllosphaerae]|uniref:type VI secretion system baseplate subunit TssK n=1 Tax=Erwinia phyllosphaerae TaxID=2853256 RepID=UPI001FEDA07B|nr:type VI secretion system baseplate subunit TssK [Erwinia phyllosphaerae]MBV4366734.1 type VI secretion system baseplate subunit TssK [Erwinia phyllosphaerae]
MYPEQQQIYWHSGLYLQPQHFQSLDLHNAWLHARYNQLARPYNVGIIEVTINSVALEDAVLSVDNLRFLMPGGDYLQYPGNCQIAKRDFRDLWQHRDRPLTFWLALKRFDPVHRNVTLPGKEGERAGTRWLSGGEATMMKDVYDHAPDAAVTRLSYNVQLLTDAEKESAVDCEYLPLIRLSHDGEKVICDPDFSAPAVTLRGSPTLAYLIDSLYFEISARTKKLEEYKRTAHLNSRRESGNQLIQLLAIRSLNRALPILKNYIEAQQVHPWQIYNLLCQLTGDLSSFSDSCSCLGEWRGEEHAALRYDHYQLCHSFSRVRQTLLALINDLVLENNTYIRLGHEKGIYSSALEEVAAGKKGQILLMLRSSQIAFDDKRFSQTGNFKLAAREAIDDLIQHALPGIPITRCAEIPHGVPNRNDTACYFIRRDGELWQQVETNRSIAFYSPDMPDDLLVQLVCMEGE